MKVFVTKNGYRIYRLLTGRNNVFLVNGGGLNILVDTGISWYWKTLQKRLEMLRIYRLDFLVITHAHFDHTANASRIREKYGPMVMIHQSEAGYLESGKNIPTGGTLPATNVLVGLLSPGLMSRLSYASCPGDIPVFERYDFSPGLNAYLLHTPGHTPGSLSLIVDDEIALAGDAMFGVFPGSVMPPYGLDRMEIARSWGKLLETGCHSFLPAHGAGRSRGQLERGLRRFAF